MMMFGFLFWMGLLLFFIVVINGMNFVDWCVCRWEGKPRPFFEPMVEPSERTASDKNASQNQSSPE